MEPMVLLPMLLRFQRSGVSPEAKKRLRSAICGHHGHLTPASILQSNEDDALGSESLPDDGSPRPDESNVGEEEGALWRPAAASVLQWAWVQLAYEELEDPHTAQLGLLEKSLLLQPRLAASRIQRRRQSVVESLETLRLDPLHLRLLQAPLERQLPRRRPSQSQPSRDLQLQHTSSIRASSSSSSTSRLIGLTSSGRSVCGGRQRSLPSLLHGIQVAPASAPSSLAPLKFNAEPLPLFARADNAVYFGQEGRCQPLQMHSWSSSSPVERRMPPTDPAWDMSSMSLVTESTKFLSGGDHFGLAADQLQSAAIPGRPAWAIAPSPSRSTISECRPQQLRSPCPRTQTVQAGGPQCSSLREALGLPPMSPRENLAVGDVSAVSLLASPQVSVLSGRQRSGQDSKGRPTSSCVVRRNAPGHHTRQREADCSALAWRHWRRPGSAPAGDAWTSPGRLCTPLRA